MAKDTPARRWEDHTRDRLIKLFSQLGDDNSHVRETARGRIVSLLSQHGKSWSDIIQLLGGAAAVHIHADITAAIITLGSSDPDANANARQYLDDLLARNRMTWNDLTAELIAVSPAAWVGNSPSASADPDRVNPLDLVYHLLREYVGLSEHQYIVLSLWILHTHVFRHFTHTPRLVLRSPVPNCGKSTVMRVLERLTARAKKFDTITPAALCHIIDKSHGTMLIDEADHLGLGLQSNGKLCSLFNGGHCVGGTSGIQERGETREFSSFAPLGLALPDVVLGLPRTLNSRAITLVMERYAGTRELRRLDPFHPDPALDAAYTQILLWAREQQQLDPDPEMPKGVRNRLADNFRPLLSISDALGWSVRARKAMAVFMREHEDGDMKIVLLSDIKKIFDTKAVDRLPTSDLLTALYELEGAGWCEFLGVRSDQAPHKIKDSELAHMVRAFGIRPRTVWPLRRTKTSKSSRGFTREQFERPWTVYCSETDTPTQSSKTNRMQDA
jgi:hypothetical protein